MGLDRQQLDIGFEDLRFSTQVPKVSGKHLNPLMTLSEFPKVK